MLIKVNDDLLAVKFRHGVEGKVKPNGHKNRNVGRHYTECVIKLKRSIDKWYDSRNRIHETKISFFDEVASGKSTCSFCDNYKKEIGRAISFSRAVEWSTNEFIKKNKDFIIDEFCKLEKISTICAIPPKPSIKIEVKTTTDNNKTAKIADCPNAKVVPNGTDTICAIDLSNNAWSTVNRVRTEDIENAVKKALSQNNIGTTSVPQVNVIVNK
jgi:hypothetical protein